MVLPRNGNERERERLNMTSFRPNEMGERFIREERRTGNFYVGVGLRF